MRIYRTLRHAITILKTAQLPKIQETTGEDTGTSSIYSQHFTYNLQL
jgi:hypothetical protein